MTNDEINALAAFAILALFLAPWLVNSLSSAVKLAVLVMLATVVIVLTIGGLIVFALYYAGVPLW